MKKISQRDIAKTLGINVSSVSRALKGQKGVSEELRQKIECMAAENGYQPMDFAAAEHYDATRIIGIVVPDMSYNLYAHIVKWIESEARKSGYMSIVTDTCDRYDYEVESVERLVEMHVSGIIVSLSQETTDYSHLLRVKEHGIPLVLFDRAADVDVTSVVINDADTARQATHYLIDGGARRIAFLGGSNKLKQTADRKHGYLEALRERSIPIRKELVRCHDATFNSGLTDTLELLNLPEPPDAIIATFGPLATSSMVAIKSRNLRIPEDVSVIGYMSDWVSDVMNPRISYVKQNPKEIGTKAFRLLLDQINGDDRVRRMVVKTRLEIRESTRNT